MNDNDKYKVLAKLFFKKMIVLERDLNKFKEKIENSDRNDTVKLFVEIGDIIPLLDFVEIVGISDDKKCEKLYDDISTLTGKTDNSNLNEEVDKFFENYV
jgi:vacuolar-type H+-ATPase subunit F/Vma7